MLVAHGVRVQVMDELGIDAIAGAAAAPRHKVAQQQASGEAAAADANDAEVERLLQALRS
jgi:hypothetical protein